MRRVEEASGEILHSVAMRKEIGIEEGRALPDPVYIRIAIPPKDALSREVG